MFTLIEALMIMIGFAILASVIVWNKDDKDNTMF